ncbi:hypothetical protein [Sphingomonas sp. IW22]|uniref:hypothetical protein n=1 Tax=Sphingomonas sp. IW22 TaxID=3242489 RepID=UPI00351FD10B
MKRFQELEAQRKAAVAEYLALVEALSDTQNLLHKVLEQWAKGLKTGGSGRAASSPLGSTILPVPMTRSASPVADG